MMYLKQYLITFASNLAIQIWETLCLVSTNTMSSIHKYHGRTKLTQPYFNDDKMHTLFHTVVDLIEEESSVF